MRAAIIFGDFAKSTVIAALFLGCSCGTQAWAVTAIQPADCWTLQRNGRRVEAQACYESLVRSTSAYLRAEGYWGTAQYTEANDEFRLATAPAGSNPDYRVRWGMLLHERFNNAEAVDLFSEALQKDPGNAEAYLGLAEVSADGFDGRALEYVGKAIALNPQLVKAHELLAELSLENDDTAQAIRQADDAIAISGDALDAMAIHAAVDLNADQSADAWFAKIRAINPGYGEGYALVAHDLELHYRYEDAISYYRKAVEVDPRLWSARSRIGIALMRMGNEQEPLQQLEMCYDNGYRDAATVNSLRLLDSYKNFVTFKDNTTILRFRKDEAELLHPYFEAELHRILAGYQGKYKMTLPGPVQIEVYPDHEDFAVRTMGMPGLGALGVTFGEVIAMDSPSARKPGEFNWGSTLWHEMSHVFILTATNHRVPRWFTEGLAVHEEGQASPEWSNRVTPEVLLAIRDRKLLPVAELDRGFVFPSYSSQVVVSYFQAGSICDYVRDKWSEGKLLEMVQAYEERKTTAEVVKQTLGLTPEDLDKQYLDWIDKRYGKMASGFEDWRKLLKTLADSAQQKQYSAVIAQGPAVLELYPEYVGDANAFEFLADAYLAKGLKRQAGEVLANYRKMGGGNPSTLKQLAGIQEELGQEKDAVETLESINYIYPEDEGLHHHLGDLLLAESSYDQAIREYSAVLALNPLDKAGAEFNLAQAYFAAGKRDQAEETVLLALERAPGFRPAQKLLLEINQDSKHADNPTREGITTDVHPR